MVVLHNWFMKKSMEMFYEYFEVQLFYDTKTKAIYKVSEIDNHVSIEQYTNECQEYAELYKLYKEWKQTEKR